MGQRILGLTLGYEDLNDHDALRKDPLLGAVLGRLEKRRDDCEPLAGKSTLNRLELAAAARLDGSIARSVADFGRFDALLAELFAEASGRRRRNWCWLGHWPDLSSCMIVAQLRLSAWPLGDCREEILVRRPGRLHRLDRAGQERAATNWRTPGRARAIVG